MSDFDARPLQRQLMTLHDKNGNPYLPEIDPATGKPNDDGVFGTITQSALVKYQNEHNLTESGQPDDPTMISLGLKPQPTSVVKWSLPTFSIPAIASDYFFNWIQSKINIWAAALALIIIGVLNGWLSKLGIQLDDTQQKVVAAFLVAVMGVGVNILRTFFNKPKVVAGKTTLTN